MAQGIHITLRYNLAIGNVNLKEIVYHLNEMGDTLTLKVLEKFPKTYDDLIAQ